MTISAGAGTASVKAEAVTNFAWAPVPGQAPASFTYQMMGG
jgi:hypothetical protein